MTNEEALKLVINGKYAEADEIIIEALKRQIPKKVQYTIGHAWGTDINQPVCPVCDYYLTPFEFIGVGPRITYCEHCGSAIDWSD